MGLGDFISGIFGSKNEFHANSRTVDNNAYEYGGRAGGADEAANRMRGWADSAQSRQGAQADYGQANWDRTAAGQARQGQADVTNMLAARAMGQTPSIAGMQADRQMQQATAAQASQQASARGAAGVALAGQAAAGNISNAHSAISNQAQINAAQERAQAEQAAFGAFSGIRGGDQTSGQMAAQNAQFNANLHQQQRSLNDQMSMGMTQNEMGVRNAQMTGGMNREAQQSANFNAAQGINAGIAGQNSATNQENSMGLIKTAASVAGGAAMSDMRAKEDIQPLMYAKSTWGTKPADTAKQEIAMQDAGAAASAAKHASAEADKYVNPYQKDVDRVAATRRAGLEPNAADLHDEKVGRAMLRYQQQRAGMELPPEAAEEKPPASGGKSGPKATTRSGPDAVQGMGAALKDWGSSGSRADLSYHGPGAYIPPQLLSIGARAKGGPVIRNKPYLVGERGPEIIVPSRSGTVLPNEQVRDLGEIDRPAPRDLGEVEDWDKGVRDLGDVDEEPRDLGDVDNPRELGGDLIAAQEARPQALREGRMEATFRRDSPKEQRSVMDAYLARAARETDAMRAGMKQSLARGASVSRYEGELDNEPTQQGPANWLADYMAEQQGPRQAMISDSRAKEAAFQAGQQSAVREMKTFQRRDPALDRQADTSQAVADSELARAGYSAALPMRWPAAIGHATAANVLQYDADADRARADKKHPVKSGKRIEAEQEAAIPSHPEAREAKGDMAARARWAQEDARAPREMQSFVREHPAAPTTMTMPSEMGGRAVERGRAVDYPPTMIAQPKIPYDAISASMLDPRMMSDEKTKDRLDEGARSPLAGAARSMAGSAYAYKPGYTPPEQDEGEENVGPMAQNMARDPVAKTIVKKSPEGLLMLDTNKMVKTLGAIAADQQRQHDEERITIGKLIASMQRRR